MTAFKLGGETAETYRIKWEAWAYLWAHGCREIGFEVPVSRGHFIADVVGVAGGKTVWIVEVKVSRSDLLRDHETPAATARRAKARDQSERLRDLAGALRDYEVTVRRAIGHCARHPQCPGYKWLSREASAAHHRSLQQIARSSSGKFSHPTFLGKGHHFVLACPAGLATAEDLPPQWGLIHSETDIAKKPPRQPGEKADAAAVMRAIAHANTTAIMRAHGCTWRNMKRVWPAHEELTERD